ncbi:MAG TPA: LuxR C-terminal-related transcriptional regulator [Gammaproteobacteria bacterium]|nr:LuxR C-terminal-related transcriptional regulator [Niabella sp.]HRA42345.1 LuxR C-terminal-related transcriptional regulator [Gammaproteobacteria bacterium]HRB37092.1 LuxR C-terminal-related transcriptional regulator [Niabella sp.]HRB44148.1 LuxR C-terminal-related transcriptional regulator [Niabella sp.]HRB60517.1 LuxR C-terminal-related transcriptional regulator [Niabella sp.]
MNLNAELTKRETEVAEFIAWGAAEKQIAYKLRIAVNTVKNTKRNIYEKTAAIENQAINI